jgi:hypothetical protein
MTSAFHTFETVPEDLVDQALPLGRVDVGAGPETPG